MIIINKTNINTWDKVYSEGRSLLEYPDENVVASLNKNRQQLNKGLDIACGAGRHTFLMADMGIKSLGIDSSEAAINFAKNKAKKLGYENIKFDVKKIQNAYLEPESYDIIIVWGLFHYLSKSDREKLIEKVYDALLPSGILLTTLRSIKDSRIK